MNQLLFSIVPEVSARQKFRAVIARSGTDVGRNDKYKHIAPKYFKHERMYL